MKEGKRERSGGREMGNFKVTPLKVERLYKDID